MSRPWSSHEAPPKELVFSKMAGGGNDFVMIDNRDRRVTNVEELTRRICTRRLSVGADGLILIESSGKATFRMRYFNADGSLADFCGNGTRCAARFAFMNVIAPKRMTIETDAGVVGAEVSESRVTLSLPPPHGFQARRPLEVGGTTIQGSFLVVGVPHYVIFLKRDLWAQQIEPLGRLLRHHPALAPHGANVDFVVLRDWNAIEVRTYERGVEAETLSCGSGVVASVAVAALLGKARSPVSVLTRSGITLSVAFGIDAETRTLADLKLTGDARLIYRASLTSETIEGFDPEWVRNPTANDAAP